MSGVDMVSILHDTGFRQQHCRPGYGTQLGMGRGSRGLVDMRMGAAFGALALLAGCGGGGGPVSAPPPQPSPTPSPTPTPSPIPTPTPTSSFDTAEFRRSDGPRVHDALPAWQSGASGQGQTIAIIDSGIDTDSPEFTGRIHADSRDVAGSRTIEAEDDHGTHVALVAAAARNNTGIMGIAFDATLLVLRADEPGSCAAASGSASNDCSFFDTDIATGVDQAIASGARVINLSLGGGAPAQVLRSAIQRAAAAGIVVVVSAGNDGGTTDPTLDPTQPDPFATGLVQAGNGNVIIAGSIDANDQFSSFSNRAGSFAGSFISALGENVCCVYVNGVIDLRFGINGTSFSAPQVTGAVALLAQAFPNLTANQIVSILLSSARDAGALGPDAIYGSGILDIAAAFAPQGITTLAGSTSQLALGDDAIIGSSAMGDALGQGTLSTVVLDRYRRAYGYDLAHRSLGAQQRQTLLRAVDQHLRQVTGSSESAALAFTLDDRGPGGATRWSHALSLTSEDAEQARVLAARVIARIAPGTQLGLAYSQNAQGLVAQLQGHSRPAFLIADVARDDIGFSGGADMSLAVRHELAGWGLTISAGQGGAWLGTTRQASDLARATRENYGVRSVSLDIDRRFGPLAATLGASWLDENRTILGGYVHEAFGARGAQSLFLDAGASLDLGAWRAGADYRQGFTRARRGGAIAAGSGLASNGWSIDLARSGWFQSDDSLGFRIAQPLRVTRGGLKLELPVGYDYAAEAPLSGQVPLSLEPAGRELVGELAWRGALWGGGAAASLFYRQEPGHYAAAPPDAGVAFIWSRDF